MMRLAVQLLTGVTLTTESWDAHVFAHRRFGGARYVQRVNAVMGNNR
jgi:hypothetical protein